MYLLHQFQCRNCWSGYICVGVGVAGSDVAAVVVDAVAAPVMITKFHIQKIGIGDM